MKIICLALVCVALSASAQDVPAWVRADKKNPFSDASYIEYTLRGTYLQSPRDQTDQFPLMTIHCQAGRHSLGYHVWKNGQIASLNIAMGAILHPVADGVIVLYRIDDGPPKQVTASGSTDGSAVFFAEQQANEFFYGHDAQHRENSGPPTRKLVVMVDESLAGKIVARFDLPDPEKMAEDCGLIWHRQAK